MRVDGIAAGTCLAKGHASLEGGTQGIPAAWSHGTVCFRLPSQPAFLPLGQFSSKNIYGRCIGTSWVMGSGPQGRVSLAACPLGSCFLGLCCHNYCTNFAGLSAPNHSYIIFSERMRGRAEVSHSTSKKGKMQWTQITRMVCITTPFPTALAKLRPSSRQDLSKEDCTQQSKE